MMRWHTIATYTGVGTEYELQIGNPGPDEMKRTPSQLSDDGVYDENSKAIRVVVASGPVIKQLKWVALTGAVAHDLQVQRDLAVWMMDEALDEVANEVRKGSRSKEQSAAPNS